MGVSTTGAIYIFVVFMLSYFWPVWLTGIMLWHWGERIEGKWQFIVAGIVGGYLIEVLVDLVLWPVASWLGAYLVLFLLVKWGIAFAGLLKLRDKFGVVQVEKSEKI